jgi:hypothetical protein
MARKLKVGNVVLCEHAVPGAGNKHTLVGVYAGDILMDTMPGPIAMGLFLEILPETAPPTLTVTFQLNRVPVGKVVATYENRTVDGPSLVIVPLLQVRIEADSVFEVVLEAEGYARHVALTKKISLNPASGVNPSLLTALQPASERSRPAPRKRAKPT